MPNTDDISRRHSQPDRKRFNWGAHGIRTTHTCVHTAVVVWSQAWRGGGALVFTKHLSCNACCDTSALLPGDRVASSTSPRGAANPGSSSAVTSASACTFGGGDESAGHRPTCEAGAASAGIRQGDKSSTGGHSSELESVCRCWSVLAWQEPPWLRPDRTLRGHGRGGRRS